MSASFQLRECENWVYNRADKREKNARNSTEVWLVTPYEMKSAVLHVLGRNNHAYRASVGKPGGKRPPGRIREENINIELQ